MKGLEPKLMRKRLGIFGGTFDPVHLGHLRMAEETMEYLPLEEVLFVPAAVPPHKGGNRILPFEHRRRMLELAIESNPRFRISDIECRIPGKSYTVKSLRKLQDELPEAELFFLVGLDAFLEMDTWFEFSEIFRLTDIVVLNRFGPCESDVGSFLSRKVSDGFETVPGEGKFVHPELKTVYCLVNTRIDISSTRIREFAAEGTSLRYLVPDSVLGYIKENHLYNSGGNEE